MILNKTKSYEKIEQYDTEKTTLLAANYRSIIENLGENINREDSKKHRKELQKPCNT